MPVDPAFTDAPEQDSHVRARLERSASGKIVKMLTADDTATEQTINDTVIRIVKGFITFEKTCEVNGIADR